MLRQYTCRPPEERFFEKVEFTDTCWLWNRSLNHSGYGKFSVTRSRWVLAYRWAYEYVVGPVPGGLVLDHLCRTPRCVNPAHLEPVSTRINNLRGIGFAATEARQTHCKRGHPFDLLNTRMEANGTQRRCRACHREQVKKDYHKKRLAARATLALAG